jgi:hypothetical protein
MDDGEWIVPKKLNPLPVYDRAAEKDTMFHCVRFKCTMKAYHCIHRQLVREMVQNGDLPKWTHTKTVCSAGQCRQGLEMMRNGWAQLVVLKIRSGHD